MDEGKLWYHSNSEVSRSWGGKHESPKNSQQALDSRTASRRVDGQVLNEICFDSKNITFIFKGDGAKYNFERKGKKNRS